MNSSKMTCITFLTLAIFLSAVNPNTITLRKILPVGYRTVEQCNEYNAIYVDKTEFALKLLKSGTNTFLFLRPRRFGKTLFLNTLESILQGKRDVFENYFIGNPQNGYDWKVYRVLRLTFRRNDPINWLADTLVNIAEDFGVDKMLADIEKTSSRYFENLLLELSRSSGAKYRKRRNVPPLALLIDEYDKPFENSDPEIRAYFYEIFNLLKTLADEGKVKFVFFTGCNKVNLLPDYDNSTHSGLGTSLGILDISLLTEYSTICGFTKQEIKTYFHDHVQEIAEKHNVMSDVIYNDIQVWYDGYRFTKDSQLLYNPISLIYYLHEKDEREPKNYWIETQIHPRTAMEALIAARIRNHNIVLDLKTHYTQHSLFQPAEDKQLPQQNETVRVVNLNQPSLESILFQNGYLTIREYYPKGNLYSLRFPNQEILQTFMHGVEIGMKGDEESMKLHKKAKSSLQNLNVDEFVEIYNTYLNSHFKLETSRNTKECETFLKSFIKILLTVDILATISTPEWDVQSEVWTTKKSSGKGGEIDFVIGTLRYRIIIECKYRATSKEMEKAWEQAGNYKFPNSQFEINRTLVRLVFNLTENGIVKWMGAEYNSEDKIVKMLGQDLIKDPNHIPGTLSKESFPREYELDKHKNIHSKKEFQCDAPNCDRSFNKPKSLSNHKRVHKNHTSSTSSHLQ